MAASPEQPALDFERAGQAPHQERQRTQQLLGEVELENQALDRLRSSLHPESNGHVLSDIRHEVRTRLNAMVGLTRLLMHSKLTEGQRSRLDQMNSSAHALLGRLNDVLDLSRIEAGELDFERVPYRLHETLEELSTLYAGQTQAKSMKWTLQLSGNLPDMVVGDPGRLRQVLANLLSNALKFTPQDGQIRVSAQAQTGTRGLRLLQLQVQDSGVGITKDHQATIFDAFAQGDASTARCFDSSGLGLAICAKLTQLMGGQIHLQSEPGQGSTFTVTLPLIEPAIAHEDPGSASQEGYEVIQAAERFAGLTVLVAEDHPVIELLINQLLKRLGCQVRNARDGAEAVAHWAKGGVDLVLMDVQMPGTNGLQATRQIREQEALQGQRHTPIVAVTANALKGDREACLAAGVDAYTPKPINPQALIRAMDEVLPRTSRVPAEQAPPPAQEHKATAAAGALDLNALRRRLDGDESTLHQLALVMRDDLRQRLQHIQKALQMQDHELAIAHTHGLKGSLGSMTAERGARLAKGLELAAHERDWSLFGRALPLMLSEALHIDQALEALLSERPAATG